MKRLMILLMVLVMALPIGLSSAETPRQGGPIALTYGVGQQGAITDDAYEFTYTFEGEAGDFVYVSAVEIANTFLTIELVLRDPQGQIIGEREGFSVYFVEPLELPASGTYTIELTRSGGESGSGTGNFVVLVDRAVVNTLEANSTVESTIPTAAALDFYAFQAGEGDIVSINVVGNALEWVLIRPSGYSVRGRGPTTDPSEPFILLPESGEYRLVVQTENLEGSAYSLTLGQFVPEEMSAGTPVTGEVGPGLPAAYYRIYANPAELQRLEVTSESPDFEGQVIVYSATGSRTTSAYRSDEPDYDILIEPWVVREEGYYFLVMTGDEDLEAPVDFNLNVRPSELELLTLGTPATGEFNDDNRADGYAFEVMAADEMADLYVRQVQGTCTPILSIRNRETTGFRLSSNRWSSEWSASLTFPEAGFYIFTIERANFDDDCIYELLLSAPGAMMDGDMGDDMEEVEDAEAEAMEEMEAEAEAEVMEEAEDAEAEEVMEAVEDAEAEEVVEDTEAEEVTEAVEEAEAEEVMEAVEQGDSEQLPQSFSGGGVSFMYPAGWDARFDGDQATLYNNSELFDLDLDGPRPGDFGMIFLPFSAEDMGGMPAADIFGLVAGSLAADGQTPEITSVTLSDGREAQRADVALAPGTDGFLLGVETGDGMIIMAMLSAEGEMGNYEATALAIAATVQVAP